MKSLKTLMYTGIKYFSCLLYTNSLLHFCAPDAKSFSQLTLHMEVKTVSRVPAVLDTNFPQLLLPLPCSDCFKRAEVDEA